MLSLSIEDVTRVVVGVDSDLRLSMRTGDEERCPPKTSAVMESCLESFEGDDGILYCEVLYMDEGRGLTGVHCLARIDYA